MRGSLIDATAEYVLDMWSELLPSTPRPERLRVLKAGGAKPAGGKITLHLLAEGARRPSVIVKLPRDRAAHGAVEREAAGLERCERVLSLALKAALPLPARLATIQGRPAAVAVFRPGRSLRWLCPPVREGWRAQLVAGATAAMEWLGAAHRETQSGIQGAEEIASALMEPRLRERIPASEWPWLEAAAEAIRECGEMPRAMTHGDFVPENILWEGGKIAIVDWEWSREQGPELADALLFPTRMALLLDRTRRATTQTRLAAYRVAFFEEGWFAEAWRELLARYCESAGVEPKLLPVIYPAVLADMATRDERTVGIRSETDKMFCRLLATYFASAREQGPPRWLVS